MKPPRAPSAPEAPARRACSISVAAKSAIEARNPDREIRYIDTICEPTRIRQEANRELLELRR